MKRNNDFQHGSASGSKKLKSSKPFLQQYKKSVILPLLIPITFANISAGLEKGLKEAQIK